jgi:hypothetical protein
MIAKALAGLVMLIIGDSHIAATGFFNDALHDGLLAEGAQVHSFRVCGAPARDWVSPRPLICGRGERHNTAPTQMGDGSGLHGWSLASLIAQYRPNFVVIELGDTMAGYGMTPTLPREIITTQVRELLAPVVAQHLPCIWIGPPWGEGGPYKKTLARVKELSDFLSRIVAPCRYIDSLNFSRPGQWPTLDGVHLTIEATQVWDNDLVRSVVQIAAPLRGH